MAVSRVQVLHDRCAALDVSTKDVKVCLRSPGQRRNQRATVVPTFVTTTNELVALRDWLVGREGEPGGDAGHRGLLARPVLPAEGHAECGAGQRHAGHGDARPHDGCVRLGVASWAGRVWAIARLVRATRADPPAAGPDALPVGSIR